MGIKNVEFDADFEFVKKLRKIHAKKLLTKKHNFFLCAKFSA